MRKLFLLLLSLIIISQSAWSQKMYTISNKNVKTWISINDGAVNCYSKLTNTSANPGDTLFTWEYLDVNAPASWTLGFCALPACYTVPATSKADFYVGINKTIDFDCTHSFGAYPNYVPGKGIARFLIYRPGARSMADTISFEGTAAGTGIKTASKSIEASISPNPVKNDLILTLSDLNISSLSIINLVGKEVMLLDVKGAKTFDVSTLPNGIYFLHITKGEATFNKKFIISR